MELSVIIVTYRSRVYIDACLGSVLAALAEAGAPPTSEVCVVDNASTDGTAAHVRANYPSVRVVDSERNGGFAHGVNLGLRHTSGRAVLWLNPDSRMLAGAGAGLRAVAEWLHAHATAGIVGGRILNDDGTVQKSVRAFPSYGAVLGARYSFLTRWWPGNPFSRAYLRDDLSYDREVAVDWVSGACLLHHREVSDRLDGLDEGYFMYFEDVDFCWRATAAGWTVHFHPGFSVEHRIAGSSDLAPVRMLVARHRSLWRWYTKSHQRSWLKDAIVFVGVWIRCGALSLARLWRR